MQERLVRFTLSGLVFLSSTYFFCWYFGFDLSSVNEHILNQSNIAGLITIFISSPALGFITSSITVAIFVCRRRLFGFYEFPAATEQPYLKIIRDTVGEDASGIAKEPNGVFRIINPESSVVYLNHDVLFRQLANEEVIKFSARRMDIYWMHVNNISSIAWAFLLGGYLSGKQFSYSGLQMTLYWWWMHLDLWKLFLILPIIVYLVSGILIAKNDLKDSNDYQKIFLISYDKVKLMKAEPTPGTNRSKKPLSLWQRLIDDVLGFQ